MNRHDIAAAWHDVTCPEADECRDRELHLWSSPLVNSGMLEQFLCVLGHCPSACDDSCPEPCHEVHVVGFKRTHEPKAG